MYLVIQEYMILGLNVDPTLDLHVDPSFRQPVALCIANVLAHLRVNEQYYVGSAPFCQQRKRTRAIMSNRWSNVDSLLLYNVDNPTAVIQELLQRWANVSFVMPK